jgi:hypothetical protein
VAASSANSLWLVARISVVCSNRMRRVYAYPIARPIPASQSNCDHQAEARPEEECAQLTGVAY